MQARRIHLYFNSALALTAAAAVLLSPIPRAYGALILIAAATGLFWDLRQSHPVPRKVLTFLGVAGFLFTLLPFNRETLAEQSLAALTILLAVKLLEPKTRRDHLQILALAAIITVGGGSLAPELVFGTLILLICLLGTFHLIWLPFSENWELEGNPALLRRLAAMAATMLLLALPITLLLFLILPRSVNPFWGGLAPTQRRVSGFSEELQLGEVGRLALSRDVAFRAEMTNPPLPLPEIPYWRGIVMEETDGLRWTSILRPVAIRGGLSTGVSVRITYYVEPHFEHQLFLLEQPEAAYLAFRIQPLTRAGILRMRRRLQKRIRYQGVSRPSPSRPSPLTDEERRQNLELPPGFSPEIRAMARQLAEGAEGAEEVAARFLEFFHDEFTYSLEVPPTGGNPLERFVLDHRIGYCEYFASAMAVMLRSEGVPARLVAGYLGGEYNDNGRYYIVTQAAAHTWVEAYFPPRGWTRLEPTPAGGEMGGTMASRDAPGSRMWLDSLRMKWNSWVVQYDAEVQVNLVRKGARSLFRLRLSPPSLERVSAHLPWALLPALVVLGWVIVKRRAADPVRERYRRFTRLMTRRGIEREMHEGPLAFSRRVASRWPEAGASAGRFAAQYALLVYGGRSPSPRDLARMDGLLRELSRLKK